MQRYGLLLILTLLTGCAGARVQECPLPKTVTVTVDRYITPAASLLAPLPIERPGNDTCGEAVRVATVRASTIEQCNSDRAAVKQATTNVTP